MIPMKTMKHMNVLYLSIKSCSRKKDISHFLLRNRSRIVETLLLNDERSYSVSSLLSRRRLENKWLKLREAEKESEWVKTHEHHIIFNGKFL